MSTRKMVSIVLVVALHALLGYAFITGLAYNVIKKAGVDLKTFDVTEEPPPPEEKPPPPPPETKVEPPPVVAPPPIVQAPVVSAPIINTVPVAPPPVITPTAPPAPPPPPAPPRVSQAAQAKGNPGTWTSDADYPQEAIRDEKEGTVGFKLDIGTDGRVTNCTVTQSSGVPVLDETTCRLLPRRAKFTPAKDENGNPIATTYSNRIRWVLPQE